MKKIFLSFLFLITFISCCTKKTNHIHKTIKYNLEERTIEFDCYLNSTQKEKYFIFCFKGYPWLEEYSIFLSSSPLRELQNTVALIDWKLWDDIYTKNYSQKLKIELLIDGEWLPIEKVIRFENFELSQTIFWGHPTYDSSVLERNYKTSVCNSCEILTFEKSIILANKKTMNYKFLLKPPKNTKARIKFL